MTTPISRRASCPVALVVYLIRKNPTREEAGAVFDVSQSTVSRRWDLLRPLVGAALACEILPACGAIRVRLR